MNDLLLVSHLRHTLVMYENKAQTATNKLLSLLDHWKNYVCASWA